MTIQFLGRVVLEVFKVFAVDRVQQRFRSRSLEFPDPGGGRQDFQPVQGFAVSSSGSPGQAGEGVLRTFHRKKKSAKIPRTQGSELGAESSSWTP